jgi:hypothetical protein
MQTNGRSKLAKGLLLVLAVTMFATMGCGMIQGLMGVGGGSTTRELWSDVPKMDGLTQANDLNLPFAANLAIQAMFQGSIDYVAFRTATAPADIQSFYANDRMSQAGWSGEGMGCVGDGSNGVAGQGAVCFFEKTSDTTREGLAIVVAPDEANSGQSQVFFARIDLKKLDQTPQP